MKLFCIPYAGGSATTYYKFRKALAGTAEIIPLELPGKGMREGEPFARSIPDLAAEFCRIVREKAADAPYAIMGYSLGGIIAFELYREIASRSLRLPAKMIFSACEAPDVFRENNKAGLYRLPDREFIREVGKFGFIPSELKENEEILKFFLPGMKADFKLAADYWPEDRKLLLKSEVSVFYSAYEERRARIGEWDKFSAGQIGYYKFEKGAHFFINAEFARMAALLQDILSAGCSQCGISSPNPRPDRRGGA